MSIAISPLLHQYSGYTEAELDLRRRELEETWSWKRLLLGPEREELDEIQIILPWRRMWRNFEAFEHRVPFDLEALIP